MKRQFVAALVLICAATVDAQRVAVSDFRVHSKNPRYEFMGKGISEMLAVELRKSKGLERVERERRTALLEEMEIALSDLADADSQVRVGKLLTADYIVFGELVDVDGELLISLRMARVETGEIVWSEKLVARVSNYDFITGYFTSAILGHLGMRVARTTTEKAAAKTEKNEQAVVALSSAMERLDNRDEEGARQELARAREFDPNGEAAKYYLSKLVVNTTKFKVITEPYFSSQNPAYLGIMRTDMLNFSYSGGIYTLMARNDAIENLNFVKFADDKSMSERDTNGHISYTFPVGQRYGVRVETALYTFDDEYWQGDYVRKEPHESGRGGTGAILGLGCAVSDRVSLGLGVGLYRGMPAEIVFSPVREPTAVLSGDIGFLYRTPGERLMLDSRLGYSSQKYDVVDPDTLTVKGTSGVPLHWENTAVFSFNERSSFFSLKQMNDICFDRVYYYGRLLPAIEHFFLPGFSARLGIEGSFGVLNDAWVFGYGAIAGTTLRIMPRHCDVDFNVTYRLKPSRVVEELLSPDFRFLLGLSFNDVFRSRE